MRTVGSLTLSIGLALPLLVGCGGSQLPIGAARAMAQQHILRASSSDGDLLYVPSSDGVFMLTYPQGKLVTEFQLPNGGALPLATCSDKLGNVFVSAFFQTIYEYAHGGTTPISTLTENLFEPTACAVDPRTGNLAVVNNPSDDIAIFQGAQGTATYYSDPNVRVFEYCTYDDSGNLFADGLGINSGNDDLILDELPFGSSSFKEITLTKGLGTPGSMQWLGSYLAVGTSKQVVLHVAISGSSGTVVGETSHRNLGPWWTIDRNRLISTYATAETGHKSLAKRVAYWNYPRSGGPLERIKLLSAGSRKGLDGVAISVDSNARKK